MLDAFKSWLIEVGAKKMLPSLVRAGLAAAVGLIVAHQGLLSGIGITYDAATQTLSVHLGQLQVWLVAMGLGSVTAALTAVQHHAEQVVAPKDPPGPPTGLI